MKRLTGGAVIALLACAFGLSQVSSVSAATITFAGTKQAQQTRSSSFIEFIDSPPLMIAASVQTTTKTLNTKAWYDPGPPYVASEMLATVVLQVNQNQNVAGIPWLMGHNLTVPSIGSLEGYLVPWQYGNTGGNQAYWPGCNVIPTPYQCWRGVPDWLINPSWFIQTAYSINPGLPWMTYQYSGNSGSYQYNWWF